MARIVTNIAAERLFSFFNRVYETPSPSQSLSTVAKRFSSPNLNLSSVYIKISDICEKLASLDLSKGPGPDSVSALFLKNCAFSLSRPLWILFNKSLALGVFPKKWKTSYIIPIFKNCGNRENVENYRPITLISLIPKVFESFVADFLKEKFKNVIIAQQHGFCEGKSITSNLLVYHSHIVEALENGQSVDSIYTDFGKAFDKLNIDILIEKLSCYGLHGSLLNWLRSYLSEREQFVKIKNCLSNPIAVLSGVPQGAHLAPILFIIFVNDIAQCFKFCSFLIYADDVKIYLPLSDNNSTLKIQSDLDQFVKWSEENRMILNTDKCKYIQFSKSNNNIVSSYHINNTQLQNVNVVKDLGVIFDSKVTFYQNIEVIRNKALKMLGFIKRNTSEFTNIGAIVTLYTSLVRSHLENCSSVWSPYYVTYQDMLDGVQRKFLRYIAYKKHISIENLDYNALEKELRIGSLRARRDSADIIFAYKLIHGVTTARPASKAKFLCFS
ncbi:unnamed protein product [Acanthoscelides obtectus]|uniref:Reverse transcriptase domain-containing protein n=1 Tax=Acanthoscelides obtectus TaxID=200917 RepID=A0A9P0MCA5_ACAOB|nr:unnamed protein product [Acanthoscelides obtectus]CAK1670567.1 Probable RNA-directed DNA polymerase from transposon BS [Acanthoscelides obtectus]